MSARIRIVVLLDGIAMPLDCGGSFAKTFLTALDACELVERVHVFTYIAASVPREAWAESIVYHRDDGRGSVVRRSFSGAWRGVRADLVICQNSHFLPLAWLYARLFGSRLAVFVDEAAAMTLGQTMFVRQMAKSIDSFIATSADVAEQFGRRSHVPMDRGFVLPLVRPGQTGVTSSVEDISAAVGDWLWGCANFKT